MAWSASLVLAWATLAFGAVYAWGFIPMLAAAAAIGLIGLRHYRQLPADTHVILAALLATAAAIGLQLVPLPRSVLDAVSPHTTDILARYSVFFAGTGGPHPLSIDPGATRLALIGLVALTLYVAGLSAGMSDRHLRTIPLSLVGLGVGLAIVGIYGREHNNGLVYGFWQPVEGNNSNGFGPFVNRNHFAGWMLMAIGPALGLLWGRMETARSGLARARNRATWWSGPEPSQIVLIATAIVVMGISLVWTMSRSGIASFAVEIALLAFLAVRRQQIAASVKSAAITYAVALLGISIGWRSLDHVATWFTDTSDVISRLGAWTDGWRVVRNFPVAGVGVNAYADAMLFYQRNVLQVWMSHAHNDYLQLLAEGGLLVALPAAATVLLLAIAMRRRLRDARERPAEYWIRAGAIAGVGAIAVQESVEFSLRIPANALLFATLIAMAVAPEIPPRDRQH